MNVHHRMDKYTNEVIQVPSKLGVHTARPAAYTRAPAHGSAAHPHLVVRVAVEEVGVNSPVEGNQRSLRLWGCQFPRGDKIVIWGRPGI